MHETPPATKFHGSWRIAIACSVAGLALAVLLAPLASAVAGGADTPRRLVVTGLLLEVAYLLTACCCLGLRRLPVCLDASDLAELRIR